jgi:hypothetical protein
MQLHPAPTCLDTTSATLWYGTLRALSNPKPAAEQASHLVVDRVQRDTSCERVMNLSEELRACRPGRDHIYISLFRNDRADTSIKPEILNVSDALGVKHLVAQFGLTLTSTCLGYD